MSKGIEPWASISECERMAGYSFGQGAGAVLAAIWECEKHDQRLKAVEKNWGRFEPELQALKQDAHIGLALFDRVLRFAEDVVTTVQKEEEWAKANRV